MRCERPSEPLGDEEKSETEASDDALGEEHEFAWFLAMRFDTIKRT